MLSKGAHRAFKCGRSTLPPCRSLNDGNGADIAYHNKSVVYDLLLKTAAETLITIAADPKHLGARIERDPRRAPGSDHDELVRFFCHDPAPRHAKGIFQLG